MTELRQTDAYQIVWLIRRLFRAMAETANGYLEPLDCNVAERAVLEFLHSDQRLTVPEIARRYKVSRQHVQVTVNRLAERDLIAIEGNPQHKRSSLVTLTTRGKKLFDEIQALDRKLVKELFAGVSQAEQRRTHATLEKLLNHLTK